MASAKYICKKYFIILLYTFRFVCNIIQVIVPCSTNNIFYFQKFFTPYSISIERNLNNLDTVTFQYLRIYNLSILMKFHSFPISRLHDFFERRFIRKEVFAYLYDYHFFFFFFFNVMI